MMKLMSVMAMISCVLDCMAKACGQPDSLGLPQWVWGICCVIWVSLTIIFVCCYDVEEKE